MKDKAGCFASNEYRSKDFYESAFLYASGVKLLRTDPDPYNQKQSIYFVFFDEKLCADLVTSFWQRTASIDAKTLCDSVKAMRNMVRRFHEDLKNGGAL